MGWPFASGLRKHDQFVGAGLVPARFPFLLPHLRGKAGMGGSTHNNQPTDNNMANFNQAFEKMIQNEGGYRLHQVPNDRGGMTYTGISRKFHPDWPGWKPLDRGDLDNPEMASMVREFYRAKYWDRISGDGIQNQAIAETLFDFAVNAGYRTAIKLAQIIAGSTPDGIMGPKTLEALNRFPGEDFSLRFALAKIARYAEIVRRDPGQHKFLLGWINRTLKGVVA
ncbi:MAG: N-acetylmuramidase [Proteobacteria bacterium]|nr:N-acetylmuramidase [Pseudomonadota bacterium]MBU4471718.1 N-acetylmuramidase [Pseudomonadota bacterium]MCG2750692.1 hypothetical protein [Desulfobacteraceae bacterium]